MELNVLWFILVTVLFIGFFFLEGFDYGVGILLPFVGKGDVERRMIVNTIGPVWDGNEVWLLTAGGATFAAFPNFYATLFSGFYTPLFLILLTLIVRGVSFEFRSKRNSITWRKNWDLATSIASLLSALLWGVAVTNLLQGVPIDSNMEFTGNFWSLISPYTLVGGVAMLSLLTYHGSLFLSIRIEKGEFLDRIKATSKKLGLITLVLVVILAVLTFICTDLFASILAAILLAICAVCLILSVLFNLKENGKLAFIFNGLMITFLVSSVFAGLFPRLIVSSLNPDWSLTIYNASSSPYTLKIMTVIALTLVPVVLVYQIWTYYIFRKRVTQKDVHY